VKNFLKIVASGLVLFVVAAIVQEWSYFSVAWFGRSEAQETVLDDADEDQAVGALREALTLMTHLYSSGGDPRFAARMPVTPEILEEIQGDIAYLAGNRRFQDPRLQQLELLAADPVGAGRLELRTREFWIHRTFWADGSGESDPPRSVILYPRYRMVRDNTGWRIREWDFGRLEAE